MKEKIDNTVRLHDMDSAIFEIILKICYTAENLVNEENVLSVWQAAHRLKISFLVELCEQFSVSSLSMKNYTDIYRVAKLRAHELIELLENDALEVNSEDDVLISILEWVDDTSYKISDVDIAIENNNYSSGPISVSEKNVIGCEATSEIHPELENKDTSEKSDILEMQKPPQNRSVHLRSLLKASRLCLASPQCLQMLYQHQLTQIEEGAKKVIFEAMLYQMKAYRHGYLPPQALYRNSSEFEHVGVFAFDNGESMALSLAREKWYPMPDCKEIKNEIKLALFDNNVYAVGEANDSTSKVCVLKESSWATIVELTGINYFLLAHKSYLYIFNADNGNVFRIKPNSFDKTPKKLEHKMGFVELEFALSYKEYIIVFSNDEDADKEETSVYVMNINDETWRRHTNLDGPARNMANFQDGDRVFILQRNGHLWSLGTDTGQMFSFTFIKKIWEFNEQLRGALLFKSKLSYIVKSPSVNAQEKVLSVLPGVYKSFLRWALDDHVSNFICAVMNNLNLVRK